MLYVHRKGADKRPEHEIRTLTRPLPPEGELGEEDGPRLVP